VTQHDDDNLREAAIEAGARGFVLKDDLLALGAFLEKC
jgi:DNA-binding NarL/FixJ family response regulator